MPLRPIGIRASGPRDRPGTVTVPRRILVATDLGRGGDVAVRAAATRARATGAALALVHALPRLDRMPGLGRGPATTGLAATMRRMVGAALREQAAAHAPRLPEPRMFVATGRWAEVALAAADRWDADLIVIGAPGSGGLEVDRIVRGASVPVLIAHPEPARGPIAACTDLSDPALPAVRAAAAVARAGCDELHVLHALEPLSLAVHGHAVGVVSAVDWWPARRAAVERRLADAMAGIEPAPRRALLDGPVIPAVLEATRALGARLLVIGTVGRSGLRRLLFGSTAEGLVRSATCSILVVRLHRPLFSR